MFSKPVKNTTLTAFICLIAASFSQSSWASEKIKALLTEQEYQEDRWTLGEIYEDYLVASVNGQITHGDRLRLRFASGECDTARLFTTFYTMKDFPNVNDLIGKEISATLNGAPVSVYISYGDSFLSGHSFVVNVGLVGTENFADAPSREQQLHLRLEDNDSLKASDYFDILENKWSLVGLGESVVRGRRACQLLGGASS